MGLDMYLYTASKELAEEMYKWHVESGYWDDEFDKYHLPYGIIAYWRKANNIHKWFVDNIQGGEDDCEIYDASIEDLKDLQQSCKMAILEKDETILPPCDGFFFGSSEYDEWMWKDVEYTEEMLAHLIPLLKESKPKGSVFSRDMYIGDDNWDARIQYRSSW